MLEKSIKIIKLKLFEEHILVKLKYIYNKLIHEAMPRCLRSLASSYSAKYSFKLGLWMQWWYIAMLDFVL